MLEALDRQSKELDEDVEASVFGFQGEGGALAEFVQETRRSIDLFVSEVGEALGTKEVKDDADDTCVLDPSPLLDEVMAAGDQSSTVLVETGRLARLGVVQFKDAPQQSLRQRPPFQRRRPSQTRDQDSVNVYFAERQERKHVLPQSLKHLSVAPRDDLGC